MFGFSPAFAPTETAIPLYTITFLILAASIPDDFIIADGEDVSFLRFNITQTATIAKTMAAAIMPQKRRLIFFFA